ncbi:hypothetical protein SESBI_31343 [Sesbania bispinosa]|nr:hypothetical protein SESBI_31343 [Sesbania bispinosa]
MVRFETPNVVIGLEHVFTTPSLTDTVESWFVRIAMVSPKGRMARPGNKGESRGEMR